MSRVHAPSTVEGLQALMQRKHAKLLHRIGDIENTLNRLTRRIENLELKDNDHL